MKAQTDGTERAFIYKSFIITLPNLRRVIYEKKDT